MTSEITPERVRTLEIRRLPVAYIDFSQNAQNGQKVPKNGVTPEKHDFLLCATQHPM